MSGDPPPGTRIPLSRSLPRLLVGPGLALAAGVALGAAGWAVGLVPLLVLAGMLAIIAVILGVAALSMRMTVDEAGIHLHRLGGQQTYPLARGSMTRVTLTGRNASALRLERRPFGLGMGTTRLRNGEEIHVVRLAPTRTAIVVPTERGRVAIAARDEPLLIEALSSAARASQRRRAEARAAARTPRAEEPEPATAVPDAAPAETADRLTGIQRAELDTQVAADAEAATTAPAAPAHTTDEAVEPDVVAAPSAPVRWHRLRSLRPSRPGASAVAMLLPLGVAGAIWGLALVFDRIAELDSDRIRQTTLALVLGGPGAFIGATIARIWWPRLVGLVAVASACALLLAARAILLD